MDSHTHTQIERDREREREERERERERDIINQLCRKMLKNIFMAQLGFKLTTSATPPVLANAVHVVNKEELYLRRVLH